VADIQYVITVPPGGPCPEGYALQPGPDGSYRSGTTCALTTTAHRTMLGIPQDATTAEANALLGTMDLVNVSSAEPPAQDLPPVYDSPVPMEPSTMDPVLLDQMDPANSIISRIAGGAVGLITGGIGGAVAGVLTDPFGSAGSAVGGGSTGGSGSSAPATSFAGTSCPPGYYSVGGTCINPGAAFPGGVPLTVPSTGTSLTTTGGTAVATGASFGMPALAPYVVSTVRRKCAAGYVLGRDDLCYPKGMLPKRYRKWNRSKPYISRAQFRLIAKADRQRDKILTLAKKAGLHASKSKPKSGGGRITKAMAARVLAGK